MESTLKHFAAISGHLDPESNHMTFAGEDGLSTAIPANQTTNMQYQMTSC